MPPKAPSGRPGNGAAAAISKAKSLKFIPRTTDLLRSNDASRAKGKGRARSTLKEVHDLIKAAQSLPGAVQVERYAETRALEIGALQNAVKLAASQSNTRAFQSLPRHLRRRAASHNPRRVPKKVRGKAAAEIDSGDRTVQIHRKKAKLRAKGNLRGQSRTEQLRARQRDKKWLGTHIYHSKRFHMSDLWGYRLGLSPTLKSFRSSYRAARRKAILHDASYFGTIELYGSRSAIIGTLGKVTAGGAFAGKKYESGGQVANVVVYDAEGFPYSLIGPAQVIWEGIASNQAGSRRLWLRIHPSIFDRVLAAVTQAAGTGAGPSTDQETLSIRDLRDKLEAFEIMGPLSGRVIKRVLRVIASESSETKKRFETLLGVDPAQCPTDSLLGVTVYDPRLSFPPRHLSQQESSRAELYEPDGEAAASSLWDRCHDLSGPKFKKSDLDLRRQKGGIPGTRLPPLAQDDRVPVMIIKRSVESRAPDHESAGFQGYTLLFPRGWSMAFLPSFIHCNARLGGLAERRVQYREAGVPSFPEHYGVVCPAGADWEAEAARADERRWLRKPPGKRPEFSTLGVQWPFKPDWSALLSADQTTTEEDGMNGDLSIKPWLFNPVLAAHVDRIISKEDPSQPILAALNEFAKRRGHAPFEPRMAGNLLRTSLCHVEVQTIGRGSPSDMAMLFPLSGHERTQWLNAIESDSAVPEFDPLGAPVSAALRLAQTAAPTEIMGFVSTGNISLIRGHGHGLATVKLDTFLQLLQESRSAAERPGQVLCLVRNRDGVLYRLASLTLVQ